MKTEKNLHEVYVKYGQLADFISLDPAEISWFVGQTPQERPAPVFTCLKFVLLNAPFRCFLLNQAWCYIEFEFDKGAAPTESVSGCGGLCERGGESK